MEKMQNLIKLKISMSTFGKKKIKVLIRCSLIREVKDLTLCPETILREY